VQSERFVQRLGTSFPANAFPRILEHDSFGQQPIPDSIGFSKISSAARRLAGFYLRRNFFVQQLLLRPNYVQHAIDFVDELKRQARIPPGQCILAVPLISGMHEFKNDRQGGGCVQIVIKRILELLSRRFYRLYEFRRRRLRSRLLPRADK
jgi:hypothetical protein